MFRTLLAILILAAPSGAAFAAGQPAPALDMSRSVTLTGAELQAYLRAALAASEAQKAAEAATSANDKIRAALTPPTSDTAPPAADK